MKGEAKDKGRPDFDRACRFPITYWGDFRIPKELKALIQLGTPRSVLELGCGVGRFSRYVAQQGLQATGVDFSSVAIAKAQKRVAQDKMQPQFLVCDVTHLDAVSGPFEASFDVGCFHCLGELGQQPYVSELSRLLRPGSTHLIWAMDSSPRGIPLSPAALAVIFASGFELRESRPSRRRIVSSHWYWLART